MLATYLDYFASTESKNIMDLPARIGIQGSNPGNVNTAVAEMPVRFYLSTYFIILLLHTSYQDFLSRPGDELSKKHTHGWQFYFTMSKLGSLVQILVTKIIA